MSARLCSASTCWRRRRSSASVSAGERGDSTGSSSSAGPEMEGSSTWWCTSQPSRSRASVRAMRMVGAIRRPRWVGRVDWYAQCSSFGAAMAHLLLRRLCEPASKMSYVAGETHTVGGLMRTQ